MLKTDHIEITSMHFDDRIKQLVIFFYTSYKKFKSSEGPLEKGLDYHYHHGVCCCSAYCTFSPTVSFIANICRIIGHSSDHCMKDVLMLLTFAFLGQLEFSDS